MDPINNAFAPNLEARAILSEKRFTAKDAGISYRVLNHWCEIDLIEDEREDEATWRKLSVADILWIRIIQELREFGLSLDKLKRVRSCIIDYGDEALSMENAIGACMAYVPMFIIVWKDGEAFLENEYWVQGLDTSQKYPNYIRINLNLLWYELIGYDASPYLQKMHEKWENWRYKSPRSEAEEHVVNLMRNEQEHEIIITRPSSKSEFQISASKRVDGAQKIAEMLKDLHFGDLQIHVEHGKPIATKITRKKRVKK